MSAAAGKRSKATLKAFLAAEEADKGMAEMSEKFREVGSEIYVGVVGRQHD